MAGKKIKQRVAIDLVPIRPGEGGAGSGIWIYASRLVRELDAENPENLEIFCLVNPAQIAFFSSLRNVRLIHGPKLGKNRALRLLWVHIALPGLCLFRRIDLLHKLATETPLLCSARRVTTIHDFYYEFLTRKLSCKNMRGYERLEKFYFSLVTRTCFRASRAIIAVSEATRNEALVRFPQAAERICVIHHGAPGPMIPPSAASPVFTVLCVAKFMEHKGQHLVITAFEELLAADPDLKGSVRLVLRGFSNDPDYFFRIQQQIAASPAAEFIELVPFCSATPLEAIYAGADAVVLLSSYEGFGLPVLEAQSAGVPVICSNLPVLHEVAGNGAFFVTRDQPSEMVDALLTLIKNNTVRRRQIAAGFKNVKRFDWRRAARETIAVYQKVLL